MEYLIRNSYCLIIFLIVIIGCSEKPKNDISKEDTLLKEISKVDSELKEISNLREISKDASERANEEFKNKYGKEPFNAKTDDVFKHDSDWRWYSVVENKPESYVGIVSINRLKKITKVEVFAYRPSCKDVTDSGDDFDYSDYPDLLQPFEAIVEFDTCHEIEVLISYYDSTGYKSALEAHVSKSTPPDEFIEIGSVEILWNVIRKVIENMGSLN